MDRFIKKHLLIGFLSFSSLGFTAAPYTVEYEGVENASALKNIQSAIQLEALKKHPPDSIQALRYRAEADLPEVLKVLHAYGYYEATAEVHLQERSGRTYVIITMDPGPAYILKEFTITLYDRSSAKPLTCPKIQLQEIGIQVEKPIQAESVIQAELKILELLSKCGHPLASIVNRRIVADGDTKTVTIHVDVQAGTFCRFGNTSIEGSHSIKPLFFEQKLSWKKGEVYDSDLVEKTQKSLMESGLFSSILITHGDAPSESGEIPMHIEVAESKHSSLNMGVSYQTYYGPGLTFGWENRNIAEMGRRLSIQGDVTRRSHSGIATYLIPNFHRVGQDYVWQFQAMHLNITPFSERTYHLTNRLDTRFTPSMRVSGGVKGERLYVTSSVQNGNYWLLEFPIFLGINRSNSLLNPTEGFNLEYTATPSWVTSPSSTLYFLNELAFSYYLPIDKNQKLVIAQQLTGGFIFSHSEKAVPVSKRLFGGSEEELRGYAYYTVSPLNDHNKPIGGRSAIYYTLESRWRITKTIGIVPFFDLGNVYESQVPTFHGKWLKSVGVGFRYFSFVGPFRADVGFPLNPRKGIDKRYRILVSIGQTF